MVSTLETLIVGVDGTATSSAAVAWAAELLGAGGSIHLTHACSPPDRDAAARELNGRWTDPARSHASDIGHHLLEGDPADGLLSTASLVDADAIVVGPHSGGHFGRALGGVTRRLLHRTSIPVIVVRDDRQPDRGRGDGQGRVVACVGYGDATETAAMWAADFAAQRGLRLELLHVVGYRPIFPADSPSDMLGSYFGSDLLRKWAAEDLEEIRIRIASRQPDLVIDTSVDVGFATRAILKASVGAELVVLGKRQGNVAIRNMISPRIHQLIAKSATTVAVVPSCSIDR